MSKSKFLIDLSSSKDYVKLTRRACEAQDFLENHPATGSPLFDLHSNLWYSAQEVCKRGYSKFTKNEGVTVYYTIENYKRYKNYFDLAFAEGESVEHGRIEVPYKEHFGEPWKFDHISYWSEMGFVIFRGKNYKDYFDRNEWEKCVGIEASGRCFEDMVINTASKFKKIFGDFSSEDFLTLREKKNHEKNQLFKSVTLKGKAGKRGLTGMVSNEKYIRVTPGEISHRWARWYIKTPHGQENWKDSLEEILKNA